MGYSDSERARLLTRQKSAMYSSSLRPQAPLRSLPGRGSRVTLLIYVSRFAQSRSSSEQALKRALRTQLQGCIDCMLPTRKPNPRHVLHPGAASANVSDRVQSIFVLFLGKNPER